MKLKTKTSLFAITIASSMLVILITVSLYSFRQFSISTAQERSVTAAEVALVGLTELMVNGVIQNREAFLKRLATIQDLKSVRIIRGPLVAKQYGTGFDFERPMDTIDEKVLATGIPYFGIIDEWGEPTFRSTIPFKSNTKNVTPTCRTCHDVSEESVLGAITMTFSIASQKNDVFFTVFIMTVVISLFGVLIVFFMRRLTQPMVITATNVQKMVGNGLNGDFSSDIEKCTNVSNDEIGEIAQDIHKLMLYLDKGLDNIRSSVAQLIQFNPTKEGNMLANTMDMVDALIETSQFKDAIEEDETKREVYCRLARTIREDFYIRRFSIYEIDAKKNKAVTISVDGEEGAECRWCSPQILIRSEACRARRTGHTIDSTHNPLICPSFQPGDDEERLQHICIPVIQSGVVGSVVQLVVDQSKPETYEPLLPYVKLYLREAAPVIEAKRLMDTLRESTLIDAMTGLHNRRFLEEYVETLIANAERNQKQISIMMLDLDYFKKVNDTYGHDVGDTVLKELAKVLKNSVRTNDMVIRYGGEEFVIILVDSVQPSGDAVAEKIRAAVEQMKIQVTGAVLKKTISIGIADYPTDGDSFWQVIKFADVALYEAKENGRNRVVHFSPEMWEDGEEF
ncbi:MAG: diguanylate cyclase [Gammaproteobacteria bacterium]|nr:diguanylate cyclase [Gammaproteobacteria bacterium]